MSWIKLESVAAAERRQAKNKGYIDVPVGIHIEPKRPEHKTVYLFRRFYIEPKYHSQNVNQNR